MSSTRFKKDKEIIADYETQVKGAVCVCVCVCVRSVCIVSAEADSDWPGASVLYQPVVVCFLHCDLCILMQSACCSVLKHWALTDPPGVWQVNRGSQPNGKSIRVPDLIFRI